MSRPLITLYTSMAEFEALHERYDRTRSTSKSVTVEREALTGALIMFAWAICRRPATEWSAQSSRFESLKT